MNESGLIVPDVLLGCPPAAARDVPEGGVGRVERHFSDQLEEVTLVKCLDCNTTLPYHQYANHKVAQRKKGLMCKRFDFVLVSHHRCKLCSAEMVFCLKRLEDHCRNHHKWTLKQYKSTYLTGSLLARANLPPLQPIPSTLATALNLGVRPRKVDKVSKTCKKETTDGGAPRKKQIKHRRMSESDEQVCGSIRPFWTGSGSGSLNSGWTGSGSDEMKKQSIFSC